MNPRDKELFKQWAKEEFCDDYGQLLHFLLQNAMEYQRLKEMFFNNELSSLLGLDNKERESNQSNSNMPKSISGQPIKFNGGKDGKDK